MKKVIAVFILILLLAAFAAPAASSTEYVRAADSGTVSQTVKSQLDAEETDTVIRIYSISIQEAFTEFDSIDEALVSDKLSGVYYAVIGDFGSVKYYENIDGTYRRVSADTVGSPVNFYRKGDLQIWNQIGSDAIIYYRYFLNDGTNSAIYYKTSQGEYVYYYNPDIGHNLFYLRDFISYQIDPYPLPGSGAYTALRFKFRDFYANPISENPWFFLSAGALALLAGICTAVVIIYRKKFRPHIPNFQRQETLFDPDIIIGHCVSSARAD